MLSGVSQSDCAGVPASVAGLNEGRVAHNAAGASRDEASGRRGWRRLLRSPLAALLISMLVLGPLSGPLAVGMVRSWNRGDRVLPALYAIAIPCSWIILVAATAMVGSALP